MVTGRKQKPDIRERSPRLYLDLYYPFHYKVGFAIEDALRGDDLSQHQTVILWIIHSEGDAGESIRRKDIERRIADWFDVTNSAISKALRSLARRDAPLIVISEDPASGREKRIDLTREGKLQIAQMVARSELLIGRIVANLSNDEIQTGLHFLQRVSDIVEDMSGKT